MVYSFTHIKRMNMILKERSFSVALNLNHSLKGLEKNTLGRYHLGQVMVYSSSLFSGSFSYRGKFVSSSFGGL
jgi:hypothetical protein